MKYNFPNEHKIKNAQRLAVGFLLMASLFTIMSPLASAEHATVELVADLFVYNSQAIITVFDPSAEGLGTVEVTVTSPTDPAGKTLILTETSPGLFDNLDPTTGGGTLHFMDGDNTFPLGTTITIIYSEPDPFGFLHDPSTVETSGTAVCTSGGNCQIYDLIETGADTNTFEGQLTFSSDPNSPTNIQIAEGEIFNILFGCADPINGQITPIPASSTIGALQVNPDDTFTVTYQDSFHTDSAPVVATGGGCGGSGGGLIVIPVVQALLGIGGGGGLDRTPPSLTRTISSGVLFDPFEPIKPAGVSGLADTTQHAPLRINQNGYNLYGYSNTIVTNTVETGQFTDMSLAFEEASKVEHVAMYLVDQGRDENTDKDPALIFDNGNIIKVDPEGIFGDDIQLSTLKIGTKSFFNFSVSFDKPANKHIIIVAWDDKRNSQKTKVFNALQVVGNEIPDQVAHFMPIEELGEFDLIKDDNGQYVLSQPAQTETVTDLPQTIAYPEFIGRTERHDDGFKEKIIIENMKAQTISQTLIGNPFVVLEDKQEHVKFFYPSNVGKSDRENKDMLKDVMIKEHLKAAKISSKLYHTNHWED